MTNLIERLTEAILRQEGMGPTYKNPGNLRGAPWIVKPEITNGFWVPNTRMQGMAGAAHVVALRIARGESLRKLITAWAPPSDGNDTEAYIKNVSTWAAIPNVDVPLWTYLEETIPT